MGLNRNDIAINSDRVLKPALCLCSLFRYWNPNVRVFM